MTRRLRLAVAASAVVALAILAVGFTIFLDDDDTAEAASFDETQVVGEVAIRAVVLPGTVGPTDVHLYLTAVEGELEPPGEATARLTNAEHDIVIALVAAAPGHWLADDVNVNEAGDWMLGVEVTLADGDVAETSFTVPISEAG